MTILPAPGWRNEPEAARCSAKKGVLQNVRPATLLKTDSNTGVFLWNLQNFQEHLFWRTLENNCFWQGNEWMTLSATSCSKKTKLTVIKRLRKERFDLCIFMPSWKQSSFSDLNITFKYTFGSPLIVCDSIDVIVIGILAISDRKYLVMCSWMAEIKILSKQHGYCYVSILFFWNIYFVFCFFEIWKMLPLNDQCCGRIKTSHIYSANKLSGFYVTRTLIVNWLMKIHTVTRQNSGPYHKSKSKPKRRQTFV